MRRCEMQLFVVMCRVWLKVIGKEERAERAHTAAEKLGASTL